MNPVIPNSTSPSEPIVEALPWLLVPLCRYLNDVYSLEVLEGTSLQWECPNIEGPTPSPRESHSSITIGNKLLIYGGMSGKRLSDLWSLNIGMSRGWYCMSVVTCACRVDAVERSDNPRPLTSPTQLAFFCSAEESDVCIWRLGASAC